MHFASEKMLGGKLKDAATRCVLRPVDASRCVCGPSRIPLRVLRAFPRPSRWICGRRTGKEGMKRLGMERKRKWEEGKGRGKVEKRGRGMKCRGDLGTGTEMRNGNG